MRSVLNNDQFTPFGLWIRQYGPQNGVSVTNLDYVLEDYTNKRIMLFEEKSNGGGLHNAQTLTFEILDRVLAKRAMQIGYDYWGFFVLRFPRGCDMPGPGMTLNGISITCEDLADHLAFKRKVVPLHSFQWRLSDSAQRVTA